MDIMFNSISSGALASYSDDKTIKLYEINGNEYKIIQALNYHINTVRVLI